MPVAPPDLADVDPLAQVVSLLQPSASRAKAATGAGAWSIRQTHGGQPFCCAILDGTAHLEVAGHPPAVLVGGDFVFVPALHDFHLWGAAPDDGPPRHTLLADNEVRHGDPEGPPDVRMLAGLCTFASPDAGLLVSLLPGFVHVHGDPRLATLMGLVRDEARARRPARGEILTRLLEVLFIEALRGFSGTVGAPGLARGLADERVSAALRAIHQHPDRTWTVAKLAREAGMSRSALYERFQAAVGVAPMAYLVSWRMALAKDLLRRGGLGVGEVAGRVGYRSASTFGVAFSRHVGVPPKRYALGAVT
ncbi:MAG: AraC family transcriptional regulator [Myxococcota bacterium]